MKLRYTDRAKEETLASFAPSRFNLFPLMEVDTMHLSIRIEIFKEGDVYIALAPELNVSSFGDEIADAKESLREAIEAFLEECVEMGSLEEVLEEAGFTKINDSWQPRKPLIEEHLALAM